MKPAKNVKKEKNEVMATLKAYSIVFGCVCSLVFGTTACSKRPSLSDKTPTNNDLSIDKALLPEGGIQTKITMSNGVTFVSTPDMAELNLTNGHGITVFFAPEDHRAIRTVHQVVGPEGKKFWVIDNNADGVSDFRREWKQEQKEILFNGLWTPVMLIDTNWYIAQSGSNRMVHFEDGAWRLSDAEYKAEGGGNP